jgi:hypothetical protein
LVLAIKVIDKPLGTLRAGPRAILRAIPKAILRAIPRAIFKAMLVKDSKTKSSFVFL